MCYRFLRGTWKEKHNCGLILARQWFCIEPDRSPHSPPTPPSRVHPGHCAMYSGKSNNLVVIAIWADLIHLMISSCAAPRFAAVVNLKEFDVIRKICLLGVQFYDKPECGGLDKWFGLILDFSIIVPRSSHKQHWRTYLLPSYQLMICNFGSPWCTECTAFLCIGRGRRIVAGPQ